MRLMDVVTVYLYEKFNNDIYMKVSEGFNMLEANISKLRSLCFIKL